jgi:signal transduction histidine kinase
VRTASSADAYERLQSLTRRFEAAKEEERKYIARELHDDLGPNLTAVNINLRLLRAKLGDQETAPGSRTPSRSSTGWCSSGPEPLARPEAPAPRRDGAHHRAQGIPRDAGGAHRPDHRRPGGRGSEVAPAEIEIAAFRTTQEAVTNVIRHADASRVSVAIRCPDGVLEIDVEDDGRGFDVARTVGSPASGKSVGVLGMLERARMLGGTCEIASSPGGGTRVRIRIPMEAGR